MKEANIAFMKHLGGSLAPTCFAFFPVLDLHLIGVYP